MINVYSKTHKFLEKKSQHFFGGIVSTLLLVFCLCWCYKLDVFPGLHADEAWSGLKAIDFKSHSIDQLTGMNNYTGVLQVLIAELSFEIFGSGVGQLRLGGIVFNLIALLMLVYALKSTKWPMRSIVFLLLMGQSTLFVISPRVAWEVNTFTLFFIAWAFVSFQKIRENPKNVSFYWVLSFLLANLLGSYNHILFSCLPISAFLGMLLWSFRQRSYKYKVLLILLGINNIILVVLFFTMHYGNHFPVLSRATTLAVFFAFLVSGCVGYYQFIKMNWFYKVKMRMNRRLVNALLVVSIVVFLIFHGIAYFQVVSSYKLILQVYSYECSIFIELLLIALACMVIGSFVIQMVKDWQMGGGSVFLFIIIVYLGLFSVYTIATSLRYYLTLYVLMSIYLTCNRLMEKRTIKYLICASSLAFFVVQCLLFDIYTNKHLHYRAIDFKIGNRQKETSSHFLPKEPILHFLRVNQVGEIQYLNETPYFIEEPLLFYKAIDPWNWEKKNKAFVDYSFTKYGTGFLLFKENK